MIAGKMKFLSRAHKSEIIAQRGGGLVEILLAMVIISVAAPFTYSMIAESTHAIHNMAIANDIISLKSGILNFVRLNQDLWPTEVQIKMSDDELAEFSDSISSGFIDKYTVHGGTIIDVYLAFDLDATPKRIAQIAQNIGDDAAVVADDGIAYSDSWAVTAPDFKPGNLIYKISRDLSDRDTSRFLHRGASGTDNLNTMERDLNMGGYDVYNVGNLEGKSVRVRTIDTTFVNSETIDAQNVYFSSGANMNADKVKIGTVRVSGDTNGFRNIEAKKLNGSAYSINGRIITDRATINNSINIGRDLTLKSSSVRTVSGFVGLAVGSVYTPYLSAGEIMFYDNFGLTVSGELMISSNPPIKLGSWSFPSTTPPSFSSLNLTRAMMPSMPNPKEFDKIMGSDWKTK